MVQGCTEKREILKSRLINETYFFKFIGDIHYVLQQ